MNYRVSAYLLIAALICPQLALAQPEGNTIEFENCLLALPGSVATAPARCGVLSVPENPAAPEGKSIDLRVAIAPAISKDPSPDPLFLFAGGPGQAATEAYVIMRSILRKVRSKRDIVLIDQRGTGGSNPLKCPQQEDIDLQASIDLEQVKAQTEICLDSLDADPRMYTTSIAMDDYDLVRQAMAYEQINLLGVSYGTRSAQVYLRQYPDRVRSMVLDSVVPAELALGQEHAMMLDQSIEKVLLACAADSKCEQSFAPDQAALQSLVRRLRENPQTVEIIHPLKGTPEMITFDGDVLAVALRFLSYSSETQALLPLLINEAISSGNLDRLASQALLVVGNLGEQLSRGMELSVMCSEDYPYLRDTDQSDTVIGNIFVDVVRAQCELWPRGSVPADFHQPKSFDLPVLLLSGERDPVTPPEYGDQALRQYANGLHLVAAGQGHSVLRHQCLQKIAVEFIQEGNTGDLETACVANIQASPFFNSLLGPSP